MKSWKLVFVAALLGFFNGIISPENPLHTWRRAAVHLGHTAIAVGPGPLFTGADFVTRFWEIALENYKPKVPRVGLRIRWPIGSRRSTLAHAEPEAADYNVARFSQTPLPIPVTSNSPKVTESSSGKFQRVDSKPGYVSLSPNNRIRQLTRPAPSVAQRARIPGIQLSGNLLSVNVENVSSGTVLNAIGRTCGIEILGKDILPEKPISVKFHNFEVEDAISRVMRISGTKNYALSYLKDLQGHSHVTQIVLLPQETEPQQHYRIATAPEPLDKESVEGTIRLLKKRSGRMFIKQSSGPDVLVFTRWDTSIVRNGVPVNLAALRVGDYVEIRRISGSHAAVDIQATSA